MISKSYHTSGTKGSVYPMSAISAFALHDAASAHVLFSMTAFDRDIASNQPPGPEAIFHQIKALQLVNKRLQESTNVSAGTIMAVVMLWNLEVSF